MVLVTSFVEFLQPPAVVMTAPTWVSFQMMIPGWVFAPRRTVTGMIEAADLIGRKHHSLLHQNFTSAARSAWTRRVRSGCAVPRRRHLIGRG